MGFINPKKQQEDNQLPGSGAQIDLDTKVCPTCRREALPWEERCAECDTIPVPPEQVPASDVAMPPGLAALAALDDQDQDDGGVGAATETAGPGEVAAPSRRDPDPDARG